LPLQSKIKTFRQKARTAATPPEAKSKPVAPGQLHMLENRTGAPENEPEQEANGKINAIA
jgi:hypothetical protein